MQLFHFGPEIGRAIEIYNSANLRITPIARVPAETVVHCMHLGAGGIIGNHPAASNQLFLVVAGEGWVRGGNEPSVAISSGQAAFWQAGEWHETRTDKGLTAIVIEGLDLRPIDELLSATN